MNRNLSATILTVLVLGLVTIQPALADGFVELASMNSPRFLPTATLLANSNVLVAGGVDNIEIAEAELYDAVGGTWRATGFVE